MPLKDLLVHLDSSVQSRRRLDYALRLAERDGAHLVGLFTLDFAPALVALARVYPGRVEHYETFINLRNAELGRMKEVEMLFRESLRREAVAGEWRFVEGAQDQTVALHARYADLTIVGQIDPTHPPADAAAQIPEETLFASGRPVVIVPYAGTFQTVGQHVVVAWKPRAEAARALGDALPLLEQAEKVTVLTVNPDRGSDAETELPVADIAEHLARHDIRVEAATTIADDITAADAILDYIASCGADFLVMGGYGHPRTREAMFGGVTRQILRQMTVPVLMAH